MGEYVRLASTGEQFKLGTCERFYWVRRDEVELMVERPEILRPPQPHDHGPKSLKAILSEPAIIYRFSWPDEDLQSLSEAGERDPFRRVVISVPELDVPHQHVTVGLKGLSIEHQVNIAVPCPYLLFQPRASPGFAEVEKPEREAFLVSPRPGQMAAIEGEQVKDAKRATRFSCIYCRVNFVCWEHEISKLQAANPGLGPIAERLQGWPDEAGR